MKGLHHILPVRKEGPPWFVKIFGGKRLLKLVQLRAISLWYTDWSLTPRHVVINSSVPVFSNSKPHRWKRHGTIYSSCLNIIGRKSHLAHCHQKHYYKKWFTATYLKYLRGRQELQLPRLIVLINRCGHFLLTKAVRKSASQNLLTETITIKMTASVNGIIFEGGPLIKVCLD